MIGDVILDLMNTSKPGEKIDILKRYDALYPDYFRTFIYLSYDPFVHFNVKLSAKELPDAGESEIIDIIDEVYNAVDFCYVSLSPKQNREKLWPIFERLNTTDQTFLFKVINKNWKSGVSKKLLLKAFPGVIATFDVQLANTYNKDKHKVAGRVWTYKLDGLRCVAIREDDCWSFYSRSGKKFRTVDHLISYLEEIYTKEREHREVTFWDGELYKHGLKFEDIQGLVMGFTQGTAEEMEFHTFANGPMESFFAQKLDGIHGLGPWKEDIEGNPIKYVQGGMIETEEDVDLVLEKAFEDGYEGIMMRDISREYDFKRSNALLKYKELIGDENSAEITSDCVILDMEYDDYPVITDGVMCYEDLLVTLIVEQHDGIECRCGSGFDLNFRRLCKERPWAVLGKTGEFKHQGYGKQGRMRFPRLTRVREDL